LEVNQILEGIKLACGKDVKLAKEIKLSYIIVNKHAGDRFFMMG